MAMATAVVEPNVGYPDALAKYAGQIRDADSHEAAPAERWVEEYGEVTRAFAEIDHRGHLAMKDSYYKDVDATPQEELNFHSAWRGKGPYAYGSYDMERRLKLMDYTGVGQQLVFPGALAIYSMFLLGKADDPKFMSEITGDRRAYALKMLRAQNDWVVRCQKWSSRLRPVATLIGETPDGIHAEAKRLIDAGVRAVWLPGSMLPGGKSPAHSELDRLWALLAGSNTVATLHLGDELGVFKTLGWREAEPFYGWMLGDEISLDPWTISAMPIASQNFTATMIAGGVFERHPMLRFASIEVGAHWLGPLARALDMWAANTQTAKWSERLPLKPSEYIKRNVRISAFPWEPIDEYIRNDGLEDCYCYASDFPHVEGGTDPMGFWSKRLAPLGEETMEKFFVSNGKWLMPD